MVSIPLFIFHFFFSSFFHCCQGPNDFTLTFFHSKSTITLFTFKCDEFAKWEDHLDDGKVNQYLVSATYPLEEYEVLRTGHIIIKQCLIHVVFRIYNVIYVIEI